MVRNRLDLVTVRNKQGKLQAWQAILLVVEQLRNRSQLTKNRLALLRGRVDSWGGGP